MVKRLTLEGHQVLGLFYNPNIQPVDEYERRLKVAQEVAGRLNFPLEAAPYQPEEWFWETTALESEPEGGHRCEVCFRLRLRKAYLYMVKEGCDAFTTTLTISPHKSATVINRIGREIGKDNFLARDFKKQDGFKRAIELAKRWALYRQNYCGCIYSMEKTRG